MTTRNYHGYWCGKPTESLTKDQLYDKLYDACALLDAKDAEIAALKAALISVRHTLSPAAPALSIIDAALRRERGE